MQPTSTRNIKVIPPEGTRVSYRVVPDSTDLRAGDKLNRRWQSNAGVTGLNPKHPQTTCSLACLAWRWLGGVVDSLRRVQSLLCVEFSL